MRRGSWRSSRSGVPDVVVAPIASGALFHKVGQGFAELRRLRLVDGVLPSMVGGQAVGCAPVATAFDTGERVIPVRPDTIARSLANNPRVILADEPTGNLDTANAARAFHLLQKIVQEERKALLLVTHNPAIAEACDWIHEMQDGLIVGSHPRGSDARSRR